MRRSARRERRDNPTYPTAPKGAAFCAPTGREGVRTITVNEIVAIVSALVAGLALVLSFARDKKGEIANTQAIRDKLDYISDTTRDTREDVRALDRKLDDHATRIGKIETKVNDHARRLDRLENKGE